MEQYFGYFLRISSTAINADTYLNHFKTPDFNHVRKIIEGRYIRLIACIFSHISSVYRHYYEGNADFIYLRKLVLTLRT